MIDIQRFTWSKTNAFLVGTNTVGGLFLAGRMIEIGRRTADIVDISFEIGFL